MRCNCVATEIDNFVLSCLSRFFDMTVEEEEKEGNGEEVSDIAPHCDL